MANPLKWEAEPSGAAALGTELNALANDARTAVGSEIANSTALDQYGWLELEVTFGVSPSDAVPHCTVYMVRKPDGTNYEDGSASVQPSPDAYVGAMRVQASTSAQRIVIGPFLIPPFDVKFLLENKTGQAFPATGSTLTFYPGADEVQ